jgi:hypothetical protein
MEDIKIGRRQYFKVTTYTVANLATQDHPGDSKRVGIAFASNPSGASFFVSLVTNPTEYFYNNNVAGNRQPLRIEDWGQVVTQPLRFVNVAGAPVALTITEILLDETTSAEVTPKG